MAGPGSARHGHSHRWRTDCANVLGALRHDCQLIWTTRQLPTTRHELIAFFDQVAGGRTRFHTLF
jgi:hypothetical protein